MNSNRCEEYQPLLCYRVRVVIERLYNYLQYQSFNGQYPLNEIISKSSFLIFSLKSKYIPQPEKLVESIEDISKLLKYHLVVRNLEDLEVIQETIDQLDMRIIEIKLSLY